VYVPKSDRRNIANVGVTPINQSIFCYPVDNPQRILTATDKAWGFGWER
jgi:hypothetical protein